MAEIKALVEAGNASAAPPLGPQLGPLGVDIGEVVSEINKKTKDFESMEIPVTVKVDEETKNFEIKVGTPPTAALIKKETELDSLSPHPQDEKVANMLIEQCIKIAKSKLPDLNSPTLKGGVKQVVGSCASSGVLVENKEPTEVIREIDEGVYDDEIRQEKTELTEEEKEELRKEREELQEEREKEKEKWRKKVEEILEEIEEEETEEEIELSRSEKVERLKAKDVPHEIIVEFLPEEEEEREGEEEGGAEEIKGEEEA